MMLPLLILSISSSFADTKLWLGSGFEYEPTQYLNLEFNQLLRFDNSISQFDETIPELELSYSPVSWASIGTGYRYIIKFNKEEEYDPAHRFHGQSTFKWAKDSFTVSYRFRFLNTFEQDKTLKKSPQYRNKINLKFESDLGLSPQLGVLSITDLEEQFEESTFRLSPALSYKVTKSHRLKVTLHRESHLFQFSELEDYMLSFAYKYKVPQKNK